MFHSCAGAGEYDLHGQYSPCRRQLPPEVHHVVCPEHPGVDLRRSAYQQGQKNCTGYRIERFEI